jgi:hypothetical protein
MLSIQRHDLPSWVECRLLARPPISVSSSLRDLIETRGPPRLRGADRFRRFAKVTQFRPMRNDR